MAAKIRLFEKIDGLLVEVHPNLAEQSKRSRRCSTMILTVEVLWTPEEEAARDLEEAEALKERVAAKERIEAGKLRLQNAMSKLEALGLNADDIKAIIGG